MMITTSSIVVRTIVAVGGVLLLSSRVAAQTETVEYYGLDALGSVRVVFDASGNVTGRMDYGPFGESLVTGSGMPSRAYAGLFRDGEAGLDHAEARSYQSRTGRFASVDPVYAGLFEPQQWNRYAYGLNNPIQNSDSTGLLADSCTRSSSWIDEDGVRRITSNCPTEGGGGSGGGWISNDLYNNLLSFSWGIQDLLFITDTAAYFGGHGSGEPSAAGAAINVEAIAKGVLDAYGEPAELMINEVKNFDAQNTQCNSGSGVGQLGACLSVLAAVAPLPAFRPKAVNLPAWRKIAINMEHIANRHMVGGKEATPLKTLFPAWMSEATVESAVRQAYRFANLVERQGDNIRLVGQSGRLTIEMWLIRAKNLINTAYPKW